MTTEEISNTIDAIDAHFHQKFQNSSEYERMLSRAVKLNEEVGELCEAVLHEGNEQRAEKTDIDFGSEVADVIICTLMLANTKNIDVWGEIEKKFDKIRKQHGLLNVEET